MEILMLELSTYASTIVHTVLSFVMWLAVVTATAALLVYSRIVEELTGLLQQVHDDDREDRDNGRDA